MIAAERKLAKFRPRTINQDLPPQDLPPDQWSEGENIRFKDGRGQRIGGDDISFSDALLVEPRHAVKASIPDGWLIVCENAVIYRSQLDVFSDVTPVAWADQLETPDVITDTELNEFTIVNSGVDQPYYKPAAEAAIMLPLPDYVAAGIGACASMRAFKEHLFALGVVGVSPSHVAWSASGGAGIPTSWTPGPANDSGTADLSDTQGDIVDAAQLGGNLIIYKTGSCYLCSYVGGNAVFTFRVLFENLGMLSRNCALTHRGRHFVVTQDDVVLHDGVRPQSVIDAKNRSWLFNQIDSDYFQNTYCYLNTELNEAWICFPQAGRQYADLALTWSFEDDSWGVRELYTDQADKATKGAHAHIASGTAETLTLADWDSDIDSWVSDSTIWDEGIFTQYDVRTIAVQPSSNEVLALDLSTNRFDDTMVAGRVARIGLDLGNASIKKLVQRVIPQVSAPTGFTFQIRLGEQDTRDSPVNWSMAKDFVVGTDQTLRAFQRGRYIAIEFSSTDADAWEIPGFDLDYIDKGFY